MEKKFTWIIKFKNILISVPMLALFAYEVSGIRSIAKYIVRWAQSLIKEVFRFFEPNKSWFSNDWAEWVVEYHYWGEVICLGLILIGLLITAVLKIMMIIAEKKTNKATGSSDEFEGSLLRYLNVSESGRCYLLSGEWGVGKTFMLREFLNKYYSKTNRNIYRISCFGLNTRKDIIDELSKVIGNADNSPMTVVLKVIQQIPVIGELLATLFKKSYGYGSVKKGSIFVFDDFERLSLRHEETAEYHGNDKRNRLSRITKKNAPDGYVIEPALEDINSTLNKQIRTSDIEKYLSMTGVINEMVEVYGYKVIIVCNTDMLGEKFVSDILRSKLNCIEYKKQDSFIAAEDLIKSISSSFVFEDKDKQERINTYLSSVKSSNTLSYLKTKNLRIFSNIIEAFIVTASLCNEEQLTNDFMDSLFSSILLYKRYYDLGSLDKLCDEPIGKNISLIDDTFILFNQDEDRYYRWIGNSVSGYWFENDEKPSVENVCDEWSDYQYFDTEKKLIHKDYDIAEDEYDIDHICYIVNHVLAGTAVDKIELEWYELLHNWLVKKEVHTSKDVEYVLEKMERYLVVPNENRYISIFSTIYDVTHCTKCVGDTKMINMYNAYAEKSGKGFKEFVGATGA